MRRLNCVWCDEFAHGKLRKANQASKWGLGWSTVILVGQLALWAQRYWGVHKVQECACYQLLKIHRVPGPNFSTLYALFPIIRFLNKILEYNCSKGAVLCTWRHSCSQNLQIIYLYDTEKMWSHLTLRTRWDLSDNVFISHYEISVIIKAFLLSYSAGDSAFNLSSVGLRKTWNQQAKILSLSSRCHHNHRLSLSCSSAVICQGCHRQKF